MKRALIIAAATIGSGIFALPYVMAQAGWLVALAYFIVLGAIVTVAHAAYFRTLAAEGEKQRLMGLARKYFGATGFWFGFVGIVVGLLLSFVIFLIVGTQFVQILVPSLPYAAALIAFWFVLAIPALVGNRRVATLEVVSVSCVTTIIIIVFATSKPAIAFAAVPPVNWQNIFLPFGIVLFALAGWTGVEPFYEMTATEGETKPAALAAPKKPGTKTGRSANIWPMLALGTGFAALLYWLFAAGILSSAPRLTADTISGLAAWPAWKRDLVAAFGIFAVGTAAMPLSHELRNAMEKDLRWPSAFSRALMLLLPLAVVLAGFNNFLLVVGLAGGVFIGMEYLAIVAVSRRALTLTAAQKILLDVISIVFLAAIIYGVAMVL